MEKDSWVGEETEKMWVQGNEPVPVSPQALVAPGQEELNGGK